MKNFLTSMLGALVALIIFTCGAVLLFIGFLGVIVAMGGEKAAPDFERGSYLVFDLSMNIPDAPKAFDLGPLTGRDGNSVQLREVTAGLKAAAKDDRIKGILIKGSFRPENYGTGMAALKEVRQALEEFKTTSHKPVKAYLEQCDTKDYYVASVANEVTIDPYGMILMPGLASEPVFFAGAFEKYGINVQVTRVGKYKSYVEPYTRKDMSPENREQLKKLLDDLWGSIVADVAKSRKLKPEEVQRTVDGEGLIRADVAEKAHLVDRVKYRDEVIEELRKETGRGKNRETFKQVTLQEYLKISKATHALDALTGPKIAVIYAEGNIVDGEGEPDEVGGVRFAREFRKLRQDEDVKAIVLRVNSPGGSATASENIQREIRLAREVKPVVVSMGSYAASGGYWISAYGERIFAEPNTITGSIGVFGIQFDVKKLANDFGITFDSVKTGKFADTLTISRPKTDEELAVFQRLVDWIYGEFVKKVADARALPREKVEEIAQGRVWSGEEAKKLGLVDEIGTLENAIAYTAKKAGVEGKYRVVEYPRTKEFFEALAEYMDHVTPTSARAKTHSLIDQLAVKLKQELATMRSFNDPQGVYARLPLELSIH